MKKIDYRLNELDQELLPNNPHLERCVLGILLTVPSLIDQVHKYLDSPGIFYGENEAKVWEKIKSYNAAGYPFDEKKISAAFKAEGNGDLSMLTLTYSMAADIPQSIHKYCLQLNEYHIIRQIIRFSWEMNIAGQTPPVDALQLLGKASEGLDKIYQHIGGFKSKTVTEGVSELADELVAIAKSPDGLLGLKGSIEKLNRIIKGYRRGNLIVISGSTGEGKTTLALQEVLFLLIAGVAVGFISLEMTMAELILKIACAHTGISVDKALDGTLNNDQFQMLTKCMDWIKTLPLYINDTPALKMGQVKATARMWKKKHDIKILFIDHLHLVNGDYHYSSPEQKFTDIANQHKELAKELDIPTVALAQLARKDDDNGKRMHRVTDLKYAGGIEQAADIVIFIWRPAQHGMPKGPNGEDLTNLAHIYTAKLRLLPAGKVSCQFDGLKFTQNYSEGFSGGNWKPIPKDITASNKSSGEFDEGFDEQGF
jgi:replicative DNA helicase